MLTINLKKFVFPFLLQFSVIVVICSLLLCGRTFYVKDWFWIEYGNIIQYSYLLFLVSFVIYFGYVVKNLMLITKGMKIKRLIPYILVSTLFLFLIGKEYSIFDTKRMEEIPFSSYTYKTMLVHRKTTYILEKMIRFYYLRNEQIYIPENRNFFSIHGWGRYFKYIYGEYMGSDGRYVNSPDAISRFYQKGGMFTVQELQELKFQNLLNNDFVLNKKVSESDILLEFDKILNPEDVLNRANSIQEQNQDDEEE